MRGGLGRRVLVASSLLALLVAAVFVLLLVTVRQQGDSAADARRSQQALAAANRLERLVVDLESGERAFAITGDEQFLQSYQASRTAYPGVVARLAELVPESELERIEEIRTAIDRYDREWTGRVVAIARSDLEEARRLVASAEGMRRVDELRSLFDSFSRVEQRIAADREDEADALARRADVLAVVGLLGSALLIGLFALYLVRLTIRPIREVAAAARRVSTGDLTARVRERGDPETRALARDFNAMVDSLAQSRAELESALARVDAEARRIEALYAFGAALARATTVEDVARVTIDRLDAAAAASRAALHVVGPEGEAAPYVLAAARGDAPVPAAVIPGSGAAGRALASRTPMLEAGELHLPLVQGGRVLGVAMLGRDTERVFGEDELAELERLAGQATVALASALSLRRALTLAELNRAVLDSTTDGIRLTDLAGRTVLANAAMERLVFDLVGDAGERSLWLLGDRVAPRTTDPQGYLATLAALRDDPERTSVDEFEVAEDGRAFVRYSAPVRDSDGDLIGRIFTLREVTEERRLERLKDEFVATVSHELRTPLTSIVGYLELLLSGEVGELDEQQRRFLEIVQRAANQLHRLVGDLLFVSQVEAGELRLQVEEVDLARIATDAVEAARTAALERDVTLSLESPPEQPLRGDPTRLAQLLNNLVGNAIKFTPAGGEVDVRVVPNGDRIAVEVADTGVGIPPGDQARLFERFYRASNAGATGASGTGLGLAISRSIAEAHGGTITVASVEGEGTTFRILLPVNGARR